MDSHITRVDSRLGRVEAKVEKVDSDVLYLGYQYIGVGIDRTRDDASVVNYGTTVQECLQILHDKRMSDSTTWNGVVWRTTDGCCEIHKNDRGHRLDSWPDWLHFRAE